MFEITNEYTFNQERLTTVIEIYNSYEDTYEYFTYEKGFGLEYEDFLNDNYGKRLSFDEIKNAYNDGLVGTYEEDE